MLTAPFLIADLLASRELGPVLSGCRTQELELSARYPHRTVFAYQSARVYRHVGGPVRRATALVTTGCVRVDERDGPLAAR
jgi:hypothetical protein